MRHNTPTTPRAIALLSGGLDSCVATAEAVASHGIQVAALHVSYGQRTARRERAAFDAIADHFGIVERLATDIGYLAKMGGSSLTDEQLPIPEDDSPGTDATQVPTTYVPFRNANLLSIAVSWAEVLGATEIYCGAHAPGSAYPDTQPPFFAAFQTLIDVATPEMVDIRLQTPLLHLDKTGIVRRGVDLGAPFGLTWSCYADESTPCGHCHSCHLRQTGFDAAGVDDPLATSTL